METLLLFLSPIYFLLLVYGMYVILKDAWNKKTYTVNEKDNIVYEDNNIFYLIKFVLVTCLIYSVIEIIALIF